MKIGSLCTGYGGLDMAASAVFDAETAWVSDIDKGACKIITHRFGDVPNIGDLTTVDWAALEPVDILTAGYPCQPFSQAGRRQGTNDVRHLWPFIRQAIRHLRPRLTVLENVAGHRSLGFDRVLGDMAEDGLHVRWASLRAADVGACHGRDRVFLVVTDPRGEAGELGTGLRTSESGGLGRGFTARGSGSAGLTLLPSPRATDGTKGGPNQRGSSGDLMLPSAVVLLPTPGAAAGEKGRATGQDPAPRRAAGKQVELADIACFETEEIDFGQYAAAVERHTQAFGRPAPSPTEPTGRGNQPRLSAPFVEWMMMLPDGWVTDVPDLTRNEALKALGNGVVPQQAVAALTHMLAMERAA